MSEGAAADGGFVVFVSYSHEDAEWRRRFAEMLSPLVRERRLEVWSDDRLLVGYRWRPELAEAISRSKAALLLVSPSFLASDFIMEQELPALVEHGVRLVPVLVRQCLWQEATLLQSVQWAHDPQRDGPVAESMHPEGQIVRVCLALRDLLPARRAMSGRSEQHLTPLQALSGAIALSAGARPGRLHDVPPLPSAFVSRGELAALREAVLVSGESVVGVTGKTLGMSGQGGIGKTVVAVALVRDETVRRHFPDGVFWVTAGERADLVSLQISLLQRLGVAQQGVRSAAAGATLLRQALADRRCLLVVDDVWSVATAAAFRVVGPRGRVLYTSRDIAVLESVGADITRIGVLPVAAAREILRTLTGVQVLPNEADRICAATGCVALAVALAGASIAGGRSWQQVASQLETGGATFLDHPYASTFKAMQVAVAGLGETDAQAYRTLAVYPEDTMIPAEAVARLWSHLYGISAEETQARLEQLTVRGLLSAQPDGVSFHDLQHEFLLLHTRDLSLLHADMLAAYRELMPPGAGWADLPTGELYIWDHLLYHLQGVGDGAAIRAITCDLAWIAKRSFANGPYAAESGLRLAAELYPGDLGIGWLLRLLTQWGHLLANQPTIGDLAVALASRTHDAPTSVNADGLTALFPARYLSPLWDLPPAQPGLTRVLQHAVGVNALAFSADGRRLATHDFKRGVQLWDVASGQAIFTLQLRAGWAQAVAFSPDGRQLASGGYKTAVQLWDVASGEATVTLQGNPDYVVALAFSSDGRQLASSGYDTTVQLWDVASGQATVILQGHAGQLEALAFSPDGRQLAGGSKYGPVQLWDMDSRRAAVTLQGHAEGVCAVAFSPDGQQLASGGADGMVRLWDVASGRAIVTLHDRVGRVNAVAFSPDGQQIASGGVDGMVQLRNVTSGRAAVTLQGHAGGVYAVAFSPDGRHLASGSIDGTVRLWDVASGTRQDRAGRLNAVALSPDGRHLVSGSADGTVLLWDVASARPISTLQGHTEAVNTVAFSPDGRAFASGSMDGNVRVWDVAGGGLIATLSDDPWGINAVAFWPDGRHLATGSVDGTVQLWDVTRRRPSSSLQTHDSWANAMAFSSDGQVASGGTDGTVRLWDVASGRPNGILRGHVRAVNSVVFSPDARHLATGGADGTTRLWDVASGRPNGILRGHVRAVNSVVFSPDGRHLATGGADGTIRLWTPSTQASISQLTVGAPVTALMWGTCGIAAATYGSPLLLTLTSRR